MKSVPEVALPALPGLSGSHHVPPELSIIFAGRGIGRVRRCRRALELKGRVIPSPALLEFPLYPQTVVEPAIARTNQAVDQLQPYSTAGPRRECMELRLNSREGEPSFGFQTQQPVKRGGIKACFA
jgi:hypothetical protein